MFSLSRSINFRFNSDFAQTIKLVVKDLIKQGKSEKQIYAFMADKYGDWIVYKPQLNKQNFILWVLPYVILLGGGLVIFSIIRKKKKNFKSSLYIIRNKLYFFDDEN